ncbi:NADPH:quinone oxidoreductase family protein [Bosea sp. OK403]|uniref:zinc-binding dehydrogenase n=1 Tax=Bosea sp. OK403 TaxID=1855286 RepID=UPI000B855B2C
MRAVISRTAGGPETLTLEEMPRPIPKTGEVLIDVRACGLNYPDTLIIQDLYQFKPERPFSPGSEVSGTVEALGDGVADFRIGDRVIGFTTHGGMAEKLALPAKSCVRIPDTMPFDEAASFLMTYGTSYHALKDRAVLRAGETLLVLGASGGTGIAAVELGKAMGARVIGAVSSPEKAAFVISHGADNCIVYPRGPFDSAGSKAMANLFKQACGPNGADIIYDPVGGDYTEAALRAISWGGRFLIVGFPAGIAKIPMNLPLLKSCQLVGVFYGSFTTRDPEGNNVNTRELVDFYIAGTIKPAISNRLTLEEAPQALQMLAAREALGKIVVVMD